MKKHFLILLVMIGSGKLFAFETSAGLKGGIGFNFTTKEKSARVDHVNGNVGLFGLVDFNQYVSAQAELFMVFNNVTGGFDANNNLKLQLSWHTFNVGLALRGNLPFSWGRLYVAGGPVFSFVAGSVTTRQNRDSAVIDTIDQNAKDAGLARPTFGFMLEAGVETELPVGYIVTALRSSWSVTSLYDAGHSDRLHAPLSLLAGYGFRF
jgi:hypothetical protein